MMKFKDYGEISSRLAHEAADTLRKRLGVKIETRTGFSNVSCSAYLTVVAEDEERDIYETLKIRFSDHPDLHSSADVYIRFEKETVSIYDECGEYVAVWMEPRDFTNLVYKAVDAAEAFLEKKLAA